MTNYGYTLMTEQSGPRAWWRTRPAPSRPGSTSRWCATITSPWLDEQGHSPYAWWCSGRWPR